MRQLGVPLLIVATCVAYLPALQGGFVWDDRLFIVDNPLLGHLDGLRRIWLDPGGAIAQYYPLTVSSFWLEHRFFRLDPSGYHAVNILLHVANALLVRLLFRRLALPGAELAALVFALHPVHVESVAWISERKNLLSGLLYLSAGLAYLRFRGLCDERGHERFPFYFLALLLFAGALLAKTVTASLPAAILLVLWWKEGRLGARDVALLLPFFVLGIAAGLNTARMERVHVGASGADWDYTWIERVLISSRALCFYPAKLIWPSPLAFSYPRFAIDPSAVASYLYGVALAAVAALLFFGRARIGRGPLVALLFFAGTLFPALGFVDVYPMRFSFV
ncbi:MAG TPA: O-GlcNAc transferase, partial [Planctomycetota bacterium]|nr:O-GlcNAc transferase [Planctomycetota bacterium]